VGIPGLCFEFVFIEVLSTRVACSPPPLISLASERRALPKPTLLICRKGLA